MKKNPFDRIKSPKTKGSTIGEEEKMLVGLSAALNDQFKLMQEAYDVKFAEHERATLNHIEDICGDLGSLTARIETLEKRNARLEGKLKALRSKNESSDVIVVKEVSKKKKSKQKSKSAIVREITPKPGQAEGGKKHRRRALTKEAASAAARKRVERGDSCRIDSLEIPEIATFKTAESSDDIHGSQQLLSRSSAQVATPDRGLSLHALATYQEGLKKVHLQRKSSQVNALVLSEEDLASALQDSDDIQINK